MSEVGGAVLGDYTKNLIKENANFTQNSNMYKNGIKIVTPIAAVVAGVATSIATGGVGSGVAAALVKGCIASAASITTKNIGEAIEKDKRVKLKNITEDFTTGTII